MPEISRFFGIIISMYWREHNPPHIHVNYNEHHAEVLIDTLSIQNGYLPPRVMALVVEWGLLHKDELNSDWNAASKMQPLKKITPLV